MTRRIMNLQTDVLKQKRNLWNCLLRGGRSTDLYCILLAIFHGTVNLSGRKSKLFHFFQVIFLVICLYRHIEQFSKTGSCFRTAVNSYSVFGACSVLSSAPCQHWPFTGLELVESDHCIVDIATGARKCPEKLK